MLYLLTYLLTAVGCHMGANHFYCLIQSEGLLYDDECTFIATHTDNAHYFNAHY